MSVTEATPETRPESNSCLDEALQRISVRPPYFGFDDIELTGSGSVRALVPQSLPQSPETGGIEAAQVARHLAILGSCAAALGRDDDKRHHYLAVEARYTRAAGAPLEPGTDPLVAEALASWVDKRTARSLVTLRTSAGQATHMLDVTYAVMAPRMFERLHPQEDSPSDSPAVAVNEITHGVPETTATGVRVDCGPVTAESCAGHFPGIPAAPVALVMGQLCRTAGHALSNHLGSDVLYQIEEGHVIASKLARAGQQLVLESQYEEPVGNLHRLTGQALADGEMVGKVDVTMSAHPNSTPADSALKNKGS